MSNNPTRGSKTAERWAAVSMVVLGVVMLVRSAYFNGAGMCGDVLGVILSAATIGLGIAFYFAPPADANTSSRLEVLDSDE